MSSKSALIVDDEPDIRELLEITLGRMDVNTDSAPDIKSAKVLLSKTKYDFCLTDMRLPDGNGIELVRHISHTHPDLPVAMITAHGNMESAIEALKAGAFDFVSKPINLQLLRNLVDRALNLDRVDRHREAKESKLLGNTPAMQSLRNQIAKLARSQAPVYISGESGSGKELVARSIHENGPNAKGPFVPVNCGAIPGELMESEFFGHLKGSFTGAIADKEGLFQAAKGGTLFLDEVADLPVSMQVKLLRAIQEKAIRPIGSQQEIAVEVRILSATHKNLSAEVKANNFRQDLYYRINVIELSVPSLLQRIEDVPMLAQHFLEKLSEDYGIPMVTISEPAMQALKSHHFPGNVRELQNILERAMSLCEESVIMVEDLQIGNPGISLSELTKATTEEIISVAPTTDQESQQDLALDGSLGSYLKQVERSAIITALEKTRWNKTEAAKLLGITFRSLRYKVKKLDLD